MRSLFVLLRSAPTFSATACGLAYGGARCPLSLPNCSATGTRNEFDGCFLCPCTTELCCTVDEQCKKGGGGKWKCIPKGAALQWYWPTLILTFVACAACCAIRELLRGPPTYWSCALPLPTLPEFKIERDCVFRRQIRGNRDASILQHIFTT